MITIKDVKLVKRRSYSTSLSTWQTYWFDIGDLHTFGIIKRDGLFRFWSATCETLDEAKQHILNELNGGFSVYKL